MPASPCFPPYQGGSSFLIFSAQGSNPVSNCKLFGKSVQKVYDKAVKGYVYNCSSMSSKIQLPKDEKTGLQLVQPYLVLQIFVPQGHQFSFELRTADAEGTRMKMYFSTSFSELKANPLHCQIPLSMIMRNTWISLALDVPDLFQSCFKVFNFRSLDAIVLGPVCKLRKIFTSRKCPAQSVLEAKEIEECLPAEHAFLAGVDAPVQVIDTPKIQKLLGITSDFGGTNLSGASLRVAERKRCTMDGHMDVAFGSTVRTNHTTNCRGVEPRTESYPAKVIERQAIAKNMKASRDKIYSSQKKVAASDIEGQSSFKVLNQKALSYPGICHSGGTPIFSVQDEFIANNFVAPEENSVDVCLNLTSKHGRKMKRLNMIKELEISKGFRVMRSSQRERGNSRDSREPEVELQQQASPSKLCNSSNRDDTLDHDQVSQNSAERGCIANGGFNLFSTEIIATRGLLCWEC
ncbi:hypothetical protein KP509_20G089200 [Ceratopteris richardii]|uniref:CFA20 domain-containing protein n=1 Tax=Ceratopteris richardii TaxID=49495 RepID=A0A8T2SKS8_CERRI|nr:hypothetical protein KP509_20G089200 [Ceratopteris richardii]